MAAKSRERAVEVSDEVRGAKAAYDEATANLERVRRQEREALKEQALALNALENARKRLQKTAEEQEPLPFGEDEP